MLNRLELQNLKKRKEQFEKAIEFTKQKKEQIILIVQSLVKELNGRKITRERYEEKLNQALKNRTAEQWIKYYEDYIKYYNSQIKLCNNLIKQETKKIKTPPVLKSLILIVLISIIISLILILKPIFIEKTEVFLTPEAPEKPKIILEQAKILEETFNQLSAIAGKPVKWQLEFNLDISSDFNTKLPPGSKLISVKNEQNQEIKAKTNEELIGKQINIKIIEKSWKKFQVIYETPPPEIKEEIIGENKKITITAPIAYSNIFSYTELVNEIKKEELGKLRLYHIKNNQKEEIKFTAYDTNENNLLDFIEFIAPETGEYEIIIEINKAEHLDANRNFISDIYGQVKTLDNNWSEEIKSGEYVRVTFKIPLDNSRDITIYPRIVSGNPRIEVYEINSTEKIAEFTNINSNQYNKILLTNLQDKQDIFYLKVLNGSIEINHIVDPTYTTNLSIESFTPVNTGWTRIGANPWLNARDYPLNYIYTNKQNDLIGEFNFQDLPEGTTRLNSYPVLYTYFNPGTEIVQIEVWNGASWNNYGYRNGGWGWRTLQLSFLNTPEKVNNLKIRIRSRSYGGWSGQVMFDAAYLSVNYTINTPPQISYIELIPDQAPIENSVKTITFNVRVSDIDGVNDINDNSVDAEASKLGETTRAGTCSWQNDIESSSPSPSDTANYSCSVNMQYYDGAGTWNIKINATDSANNLIENTSRNFIYQDLKALIISPASLTWPTLAQRAINQIPGTSTIITNTGNHQGAVVIQAKNLYGETRITEFIPANSFTAGTSTGKKYPECSLATSSQLKDSTDVTILNSMLNKGIGAQEEIFYCISQVPFISSQTYSTQPSGSWTITVLVVSITIKKKRLKKKQKSNKIKIAKDNLIISLTLLSKEIKQEYSEEKEKIIILLTKEIKKKYKLNNKEITQLTETDKEAIPLNIFKCKLGALESLCRYMKENLNMKYREIAQLLQRNERTIWTAYNKAKQKQPETTTIKEEKILLPISIFSKKLTVLESIVIYLKKQNLKYVEIAHLLNRDQRNIWTIYSRAIKKAFK